MKVKTIEEYAHAHSLLPFESLTMNMKQQIEMRGIIGEAI